MPQGSATEEYTEEEIQEELVKLIIPNLHSIVLLYGFLDKLNRVIRTDDIHGTVARIARDTKNHLLIVLMLPSGNTGNLVIKLACMPNVKAVEENTPAVPAFARLCDSFSFQLNSPVTHSKILYLTVEDENKVFA